MSGGSWDYVYIKFEDVAAELERSPDDHRRALGTLISLVADAMHDIEWVDSSDTAPGSEHKAIALALGLRTPESINLEATVRKLAAHAEAIVAAVKEMDECQQ